MASGARQRSTRLLVLLPLLIALALALAACGPEDGRERGDGAASGADTDNRDASVEMHGAEEGDDDRDVRMFLNTPRKLPAADAPENEG